MPAACGHSGHSRAQARERRAPGQNGGFAVCVEAPTAAEGPRRTQFLQALRPGGHCCCPVAPRGALRSHLRQELSSEVYHRIPDAAMGASWPCLQVRDVQAHPVVHLVNAAGRTPHLAYAQTCKSTLNCLPGRSGCTKLSIIRLLMTTRSCGACACRKGPRSNTPHSHSPTTPKPEARTTAPPHALGSALSYICASFAASATAKGLRIPGA